MQIQRSGYAFYRFVDRKLLNKWKIPFWGRKKIQIRNVIVMTNTLHVEEVQFIKILKPTQILGYVQYFSKVHSPQEVESLVLELNKYNGTVISL